MPTDTKAETASKKKAATPKPTGPVFWGCWNDCRCGCNKATCACQAGKAPAHEPSDAECAAEGLRIRSDRHAYRNAA